MSILIADCPRCGAGRMTFSVRDAVFRRLSYGWKSHFEVFSLCSNCMRPTIFSISLNNIEFRDEFDKPETLKESAVSLNNFFDLDGFVNIKENSSTKTPDHIPENLQKAFHEGATCFSIGCYNASATMFRLCVDLVTGPLLPDLGDTSGAQPNSKQRRDLGLRLSWLFENGLLPTALRELAKCIHQDGNDGAHVGNLTKADAEDIKEFTTILLSRLITEPENLRIAEIRRQTRRSS